MATQLDLQEQEQVDALKAFWKQYGNLITWTLTLALGAFAAWNGWNWYQREQALKASVMYDELDKAAAGGDVDKAARVFADLRERFPKTAFAQQGGLLVARLQAEKNKVDDAKVSLGWVATNAMEEEYQTLAHLRLAGLLLDAKKFDEALKELDAAKAAGFEALVTDRRGDVLLAQGKKAEAVTAYKNAWTTMDDKVDYRRVIEAKLTSLGAAPAPEGAASAASGAKS
jgi:predicted negative regulator of RcsB-dependent stress response